MNPELRVLAAAAILGADLGHQTMHDSLTDSVRRGRYQRALRIADELLAVASEPLKPPEVSQ